VALLNQDRRRGCDYEIVCCLTSSDTFIEEVRVERRGVRYVPYAIRHFCRSRGVELGNLEARAAFDQATVDLLKPFNPDIIMLDGYLLLLTEPMLKAYHGRILTLHHSDLLLRRPLDGPRYPGLRAVRDAFAAGEPELSGAAGRAVGPRAGGDGRSEGRCVGTPGVDAARRLAGDAPADDRAGRARVRGSADAARGRAPRAVGTGARRRAVASARRARRVRSTVAHRTRRADPGAASGP
jgi:folate-dependent phosphoribosylglycinamide formyltransferase PurN